MVGLIALSAFNAALGVLLYRASPMSLVPYLVWCLSSGAFYGAVVK